MQENTLSNALNSTCNWCYVAELGRSLAALLARSQAGVHFESSELNGITWTPGPAGTRLDAPVYFGIIYRLIRPKQTWLKTVNCAGFLVSNSLNTSRATTGQRTVLIAAKEIFPMKRADCFQPNKAMPSENKTYRAERAGFSTPETRL